MVGIGLPPSRHTRRIAASRRKFAVDGLVVAHGVPHSSDVTTHLSLLGVHAIAWPVTARSAVALVEQFVDVLT